MKFDPCFESFYDGKIRQVFVYLTSRCQLNCRQCLYKPLLGVGGEDIPFDVLESLLREFHQLGAFKVSFLGGEPTLYRDGEHAFSDVIALSKQIGYKYVRFDTNGQFKDSFLDDTKLKHCDEITFSLDGFDSRTNDVVRGVGSFDKCIANIRSAVVKDYKTQITTCVHSTVCPTIDEGVQNLERMIEFAVSLGVLSLNFHPILKVGIARDEWIDNTNIDPKVWMGVYRIIQQRNLAGGYPISVRLPMRFVEKEQYLRDRTVYEYCPLQKAERALVMPDGTIKVCAFTIGTPYHLAEYDSDRVKIIHGTNSEYDMVMDQKLVEFRNTHHQYCIFQKLENPNLTPLCMSYKPHQKEIVWNYDGR